MNQTLNNMIVIKCIGAMIINILCLFGALDITKLLIKNMDLYGKAGNFWDLTSVIGIYIFFYLIYWRLVGPLKQWIDKEIDTVAENYKSKNDR